MCECVYVCVCVCMCVYVCVCVYVCMCACVCMCMCECVYVCGRWIKEGFEGHDEDQEREKEKKEERQMYNAMCERIVEVNIDKLCVCVAEKERERRKYWTKEKECFTYPPVVWPVRVDGSRSTSCRADLQYVCRSSLFYYCMRVLCPCVWCLSKSVIQCTYERTCVEVQVRKKVCWVHEGIVGE